MTRWPMSGRVGEMRQVPKFARCTTNISIFKIKLPKPTVRIIKIARELLTDTITYIMCILVHIITGYDNAGEYWIRKYESPDFRKDLEELWQDVKPLYAELHAYVRHKLVKEFPGKVKPDEPIPAHVLGNSTVCDM